MSEMYGEELPLLTSVAVVCREFPAVAAEKRAVRCIEAFVDYSQTCRFLDGFDKSLDLAKRVFARSGWNYEDAVEGLSFARRLDVVQWLCELAEEHGIATNEFVNSRGRFGSTPLQGAAGDGRLDVVKWLVSQGARINDQGCEGSTALHYAARGGYLAVMQWLVANGALINEKDGVGNAALQDAARWGHLHVIEWLVEKGVDVNEKNDLGSTALHTASTEGHLPVMKFLAEHGARLGEKDYQGRTALHFAAAMAKLSVVEWLAQMNACIDEKDVRGQTALHIAASDDFVDWQYEDTPTGNLPVARLLVSMGLQPWETDQWGHTALFYASVLRRTKLVEFFLLERSNKSQPWPQGDLHQTLLAAARADRVDLIEFLEKELDVDVSYRTDHGRTALHEAAAGGAVKTIQLLINRGLPVCQADDFRITAVIEASRCGSTDGLRLLLDAGANTGDTNLAGQTGLHHAAKGGYLDAVDLLVDRGADVNCSDQRGWTGLHYAAASGHFDVVKLLVSSGINIEARTLSDKLPADLALERSYLDVANYLNEQSASVSRELTSTADYAEYLLDPHDIQFGTSWSWRLKVQGRWLDSLVEVKLKSKWKAQWKTKNFAQELGRWSKLNHPHIIKLYGVCEGGTVKEPYFVYERAAFNSLFKYFQASASPVSPLDRWNKLYEAALGLQYLHDRNIIHGSLCCKYIVVAANGVAKLRNFSSDDDLELRDPRFTSEFRPWTAPEVLCGLPSSFQSDVFDLGMTIVQAFKPEWDQAPDHYLLQQHANLYGELPTKPAELSATQWTLIERMCGYIPPDRPSISDVVRELESFTRQSQTSHDLDAELPELEEMPPSWGNLGDARVVKANYSTVAQVLADINGMCGGHTKMDLMNHDVYNRLVDICSQLAARTDIPKVEEARQFVEILRYFYRRLRSTSAVGSNHAARLATSRQGADDTFSVHTDLDAFMENAGLSRTACVHQWKERWEQRRKQQQHEFMEKLQELPSLLENVEDESERENTLTYLRFELSKHPTSYATSNVADFARVKSATLSTVTSTSINWFIPASEVDFDKYDDFARGGFGTVHHGKWRRSRIVVKKVEVKNEEDRASFLNEVEIWHKLDHPHVVQLFGACHIDQPFFVSEFASGGQLDQYLRSHADEVWEKLHEAALGLRYLHVKRVVHGDLKCNNILVGSDGKAKLTDFGLSTQTSTMAGSSDEPEVELESSTNSQTGALRWKAPEVLRGEKMTFASDVYSFGMCILEAVSGKYPWGTIPDTAVKHHVVKTKKIPRRPENCSDEAYDLVEKMCRYVPSERLSMKDVVESLKSMK